MDYFGKTRLDAICNGFEMDLACGLACPRAKEEK